ncbi:complex I NDUFA9 subunit family protein [Coralloluteibacterium stylophorae]|uniref:Complex I NDUFA9 subunit family protein n=1 Tax=Coralloluteibacterium stylophorae TaxID=1776034 RepID=A0A8J8AXU0_9GAMM|nr:complex I NDUFA9 subunit family protein [Coralloluteibacterium stylophorae]MBS7458041.1 complex I NDUFA9 subunit family protein [Coralloluteibacterium stylophorae]
MSRSLRIVILGGTGFIGRHLVARLAADGHGVVVLSRNPAAHPDRHIPPGVSLQRCDVYDAQALVRRFAGADAVVNLVGVLNEFGGPLERDSGRGFSRAHVELTRRVVEACAEAGARRLLQMSALNAGRRQSHYLASRGEAEAIVKASPLAWTLFQPSVVFGRGDGLFCRFARLLQASPVLPLGRADAKFAPVYVGDVVEAFRRALGDPRTRRQTYELYGPEVVTLAEIVRRTARTLGLRRLLVPLPDALGRVQAEVGEWLPGKPISRDNFRSLAIDSVGGVDGLHRLGIEATPIDAVLPRLFEGVDSRNERLQRYRTR